MDVADLLVEALGRVGPVLRSAVEGLPPEGLTYRPDPGANSVAWLVWHAARGQDAQVAHVAGVEQVWTARGWADRFGLPFDARATGYGQSAGDVGVVDVPATCSWATTTRSPRRRSRTWSAWSRATSTPWSTSRGTRP